MFPIDADTADDLLRRAYSAMFVNKRGRRIVGLGIAFAGRPVRGTLSS